MTFANPGDIVSCEPAQSKRTWTFEKSNFVEIYRKNAGPQSRGHRFVRACTVESHMDISQEPFCVKIYRKNAATRRLPPRSNIGPNCYRKNPFSVTTLFGEKWGYPQIIHFNASFPYKPSSYWGVSQFFQTDHMVNRLPPIIITGATDP